MNKIGNKCGHQVGFYRKPELTEVNSLKHSIIRRSIDLLYAHADELPWLQSYRSEIREAVLASLSCIVLSMEIWTKAIGCPTKDGWLAYGWRKTIMDKCGWLGERRMYRALAIIEEQQLIESNQRLANPAYITRDDSTQSGYAVSEKKVRDAFFDMLAQISKKKTVLTHLKRAEEQASKRLHKKAITLKVSITDLFTRKIAKLKRPIAKVLAQCVENKNETTAAPAITQDQTWKRTHEFNFETAVFLALKQMGGNAERNTMVIANRIYERFGKILELLDNPSHYVLSVL